MKTLILLLGALLFAGCTTTTETPSKEVLQAHADWAWFSKAGNPSSADNIAVQTARDAYEEALKSGDKPRTKKAEQKYIALVHDKMWPPLKTPPQRK